VEDPPGSAIFRSDESLIGPDVSPSFDPAARWR
jgi:hypothetical protein